MNNPVEIDERVAVLRLKRAVPDHRPSSDREEMRVAMTPVPIYLGDGERGPFYAAGKDGKDVRIHLNERRTAPIFRLDESTAVRQSFRARIHFVGGELRELTEAERTPEGRPADRFVGSGGITGDGGLLITLHVEIAEDGEPLCKGITMEPEPPSSKPISTLASRVPLHRLLKLAVAEATLTIGPPTEDGSRYLFQSDTPKDAFIEENKDGRRPARRGSPLTSEDLKRTARLHREAGKHPRRRHARRQAVADAEGVSLATASRRIKKARDAGLPMG